MNHLPRPAKQVQSCITSVSFPATLDDLVGMLSKNRYLGKRLTDMECLLDHPDEPKAWSAARWMTRNDILFFYHTKSANKHIRSVSQQTSRSFDHRRTVKPVLARAAEIARQYAGTIFGCAEVTGWPEHDDSQLYHFRSRDFAPFDRFHLFPAPLPSDRFSAYVKIGQSTVTPLYEKEFNGIRSLLSEGNRLPTFLEAAVFGNRGLRSVTRDNWREVSCRQSASFIHELQLRDYLVDFLLDELKDNRTARLEECLCYVGSRHTGIADYMISIGGIWTPVEVKLNLKAEPDIIDQVRQYVSADRFTVTQGGSRGREVCTPVAPVCLVVDLSGLYLASAAGFLDCAPSRPRWQRTGLSPANCREIRTWLRSHGAIDKG